MPRRDKPDASAAEICTNLEKEGWKIQRIASAQQRQSGCPDAVIAGRAGLTHLMEFKSLGGRLSEAQVAFSRRWPGCFHVATSSWEANELLKMCEVMLRQKP